MRKTSAIVIATLITFVPLSASAHDEVGSTNPAESSVVQAGKFDVSITFEEDILVSKGNAGEVIEVVGPDGTKVSNGCVSVIGTVLTSPIDVDKAGEYQVSWRSVSSDGHATEGEFAFTLENSSGYVSAGIPAVSEECAAAGPETTAKPDNFGLAAFGTLFTVIASAVAAVVIQRRRRTKD